jgi:3-oxoacyl-(acyl-carrier-protein) synthase
MAGFGAAIGELTLAGVGGSSGRAMWSALTDSGLDGADLISANGDSTRLNDQAEAAALRTITERMPVPPAIYATKGAHGNLFSAAGPLEVAGAVMALEHETLPPSVNCEDPDPECGLILCAGGSRPVPGIRSVLVNALGAFGEGASLVVARSV